jgi:uncharacterized coiled-coil DUF342 family protein
MDTAIIVAFIAAAGSAYAVYAGRQKTSADTYKEMAATIKELNAEVRALRTEMGNVYSIVDALRERLDAVEDEASGLRKRLLVVEEYLRRSIRQLQRAKIKPDLPQEAIDELFKGFEGE